MNEAINSEGAKTGDAESFSVHLEHFSGPMDLLLHLVQQRELPIHEVDLSDVCEQYLKIVSQSEFLDLDRAGEFLVIAATLIAIKSQSLLPHSTTTVEGGDMDFDPNFYATLRERLIAYESTKRRAEALLSRPQLGRDTFFRQVKLEAVEQEEEIQQTPEELHSLGKLFLGLLKRVGLDRQTYHVQFEPVSILTYMMKWVDSLKVLTPGAKSGFLSIVRHFRGDSSSKAAVIGSFISLLELMKRGLITAEQEEGSQEISIEMKFHSAEELNATKFDSEFDQDRSLEIGVLDGEPLSVVHG